MRNKYVFLYKIHYYKIFFDTLDRGRSGLPASKNAYLTSKETRGVSKSKTNRRNKIKIISSHHLMKTLWYVL